MAEDTPRSTARLAGHPIHPMIVPIPITCYVGTLVTDICYARTGDILWGDFSDWLITAAVIFTVLAAIAGGIDFLAERRIRDLRPAWIHAIGNVVVLALGLFNALVHTRDSYGQLPAGLILSVLTVLVLLVTGWNGWDMVYRHGVALNAERRK